MSQLVVVHCSTVVEIFGFGFVKTDLNWLLKISAFSLLSFVSPPDLLSGATLIFHVIPEWFWVVVFKSFTNDVIYMVHSAFLNCLLHSFWKCLYSFKFPVRFACLWSLAFLLNILFRDLFSHGIWCFFLIIFDGSLVDGW